MPELARIVADGGALTDALGAASIDQTGLTAEPGPGLTPLGTFPHAARFGVGARAQLTTTPVLADRERFALRVVFAPRGTVAARQNLVETTAVPVVLWIEPAPGDAASFLLGAGVQTPSGAWRTVVSDTVRPIDQWHTVALALDDDVLAILDEGAGTLVAAVALPEGALAPASGTSLSVGTLPDGVGFAFSGDIAALSWTDEVPTEFDPHIDGWRMSAAGVIDAKRWSLPFDPGAPVGPPVWDAESQSTVRRFVGVDIRFSEEAGNAFEIHGAIRDEYNRLTYRNLLGFPVSDEIAGGAAGTRKNLFSQGALYWSSSSGAHPLFEEIYVTYESSGVAAVLGAPVAAEEAVSGGLRQRFAGGEILLADGSSTAFEVHGAILGFFHSTGGVGRWGFPTTNELRVLRPGGGGELGRSSSFTNATIYWSPATGAHVVYGDIARYYATAGGPQGRLGFPTSDELDLPGAPGARYNTFERGWVAWYPGIGAMEPMPLRVFVGTVDTKEDEGFGRGQNDLTIDVGLLRDGGQVAGFQDATSGHNIRVLNRELNARIEPWPGRTYVLRVDVHERDPEDRPRLGLWEKQLHAGNRWGMGENNGILQSGGFSMIKNISASVAPLPPLGGFGPAQRHWGTGNPSTARISRNTFATAFPEVDSEPEWWDITDGIESIYYELVSKGLSENGNCMGFSAEGILADKGMSLYQLPLDRFKMSDWTTGLEKHVNVRHQSQVGSSAIWTFVALFLSGNTHDPVDVVHMTRAAHAAGQDPVMCLAQNYDFSGAPHVVRPIAWRDAGAVWEIDVLDPNFIGGTRKITIDPGANTFAYSGGSSYSGGEWSGGRLYFLPFHAFSGTAELPIWDALRLILGGTIAILGDGDAATAVRTPDGDDILLSGEPGAGGPNGFVPVPDYARQVDPLDTRSVGDAHLQGVRFGELLPVIVAKRMAKATGLLARARREPNTHRRSARGGHRRLRDILVGVEFGQVVLDRVTPLRDAGDARFDVSRFRLDSDPLTVTARALDTRRQPVPEVGLTDSLLRAGSLRDTSSLRVELTALAAQLPDDARRAAVIELAKDPAPLERLAQDDFRERVGAAIESSIGGILKSLQSDDFVLDTVSLERDGGRIAIAHGLREYVIRHDGRIGAAMRIAGENLRTSANTLSVAPGTGRRMTLTVTNRLGLAGDIVHARFLDLPAESAAPLTLNVRPGFARWELVGEALEGPARAVVSGVIAGRRFGVEYDLTLRSALRIQLPVGTDAAHLSVATTGGLFTDAIALTKIAPR